MLAGKGQGRGGQLRSWGGATAVGPEGGTVARESPAGLWASFPAVFPTQMAPEKAEPEKPRDCPGSPSKSGTEDHVAAPWGQRALSTRGEQDPAARHRELWMGLLPSPHLPWLPPSPPGLPWSWLLIRDGDDTRLAGAQAISW